MDIIQRIRPIATRIANETGKEVLVLPFIVIAVLAHLWGSRINRRIARQWLETHGPVLQEEYAQVGFRGRSAPTVEDVESSGLLNATLASSSESKLSEEVLKMKSPREYTGYATGRQNVAFTDIKISLYKRYNILSWIAEYILGIIFESLSVPEEKMEAISYPFDGKEADLVPVASGKFGQETLEQHKASSSSSTYDGFVWAIVHKDGMQRLRDERYDLSLTSTKDNPKLPSWTTIMSESAEITNVLLTSALIEAVKQAGDLFEYLIVTDQPVDQPTKSVSFIIISSFVRHDEANNKNRRLNETIPRKRLYLSLRLPPSSSANNTTTTIPIFKYFHSTLPDHLVQSAHFRPEITRKLRQTRETQISKLTRAEEGEKADERAARRDKEKKEKRDQTLKALSADDQRKFLEREREKEMRKGQKRVSQRS